jgi:HEAT repeat protein
MSDKVRSQSWSATELAQLDAVDRAVAAGEVGVSTLVAMLTESSWVVRRGVVRGLAALGNVALPSLFDVLRARRDDETRIAAAVEALAASAGDVDPDVMALAHDTDAAVVCDAIQVIGRRRMAAALPFLRAQVDAADDNVAVSAIEALGRIGGSAAVETLIAATRSDSFFRVFPAIDVLGRSGDPRAVAPLAALLDTPLYTLEAARSLTRTGEGAAVAPLAALLSRRGDANTRTAAVSLAELHDRAEERHGSSASIVRALRLLPDRATLARRLSHAFRDAEQNEKVAICALLGSLGTEESVAILTELVEEPHPVGSAATRALAHLSNDLKGDIGRVLRDGGSAQRLAVLPLVTNVLDSAVVVECLEDAEPEVRRAACAALARLGEPERVGPLFDLLRDADGSVVQAAVAAIQSLGGILTEKRALELSKSKVGSLRRSALRILAYFGYPSAFDALVLAMGDADQRVRDAGIGGLSLVDGEAATDALLGAAGDLSERTRSAAMKALGHRIDEPRVIDALRKGLVDTDGWVRYYACQSLGKLGVRDAAGELERLLGDPAGQVRVAAVESLSLLGGDTARKALLDAASSQDEDIRRAALVGLGMTRDPEALGVLSSAAHAGDPVTRLIAVSALSSFDAPSVLGALVDAAHDPDEAVRTAALGCLSVRPGPEVTAALIEMLARDEATEPLVVALAAPVRGRIEAIVTALPEADELLARHLVSVLGRMATKEATSALVEAMTTQPAVVRKAAATTLGALGTEEALETLRRAAQNDADLDIRRVAALLVRS